ncbi:MAG: thioredoxin family protein [Acidobacteria bacterium]|nr:thioredoxin family protein [Acidobacteriota bacterium]
MTREVYTDKEFIKFSRSQVFMRVFKDTEAEGERLARRFRVQGYPTLLVLNSRGEEVDRILGARSAKDLIRELKLIFEGAEDGRISI